MELYTAVVEGAGEAVKGAKNPYTSRNGHMYSFLGSDGAELGSWFLRSFEWIGTLEPKPTKK